MSSTHAPSARQASSAARAVRRKAVALPAATLLAGLVAPSSAISAGAMALTGAGMAVLGALLARGTRPDRPAGPAPTGPVSAAEPGGLAEIASVTVLLPARNEAAVIGTLIGDLGRAVHAGSALPAVEIVVIDDASSDGTGDAAERALAKAGLSGVGRVLRFAEASGSKGRALRRACPDPRPDQLLVVLDADARIEPTYLVRCVAVCSAHDVAQTRRHVLSPAGNGTQAFLARLQDGEFAADDAIQRTRWAVGGASEFRGNGMVVRGAALSAIGGWPEDALTEDLETSTRWYLATGRGVARPAGLDLWEQPVLQPRDLIRQRLRWAEGSIRRDLKLVLPALIDSSLPVRRRADVGMYAGQALAPWLAIGIAARAVQAGPGRVRRRALGALGGLAAGYAAGGLRIVRSGLGPDASRGHVVAVAAFGGLWSFLMPIAWIRVALHPGPPRFALTRHVAPEQFADRQP